MNLKNLLYVMLVGLILFACEGKQAKLLSKIKAIENSEKIDFTDFLEQSGYIANKEELIKKFDENRDAKEKIDEFFQ